jgi:hypothetical protein
MPRRLERVRLERGLKLDLSRLARQGVVKPGCNLGLCFIRWRNSCTDEEIATGEITADLSGIDEGWLRIKIGSLDQSIILVPQPRHFGGRQWYFICPFMNRRASVLWKPPGARYFACRQEWGPRVAYASQFETPVDRAHRGQAKIEARLVDEFDQKEWDLLTKPKWMRWRTYNRAVEKFDRYEAILDYGMAALVAKLAGRI